MPRVCYTPCVLVIMRHAHVAIFIVVFWCSGVADAVACPQRPGNIQVTPVLERVVVSLLGVSPTFSKQCDRIAAEPLVRVMVGLLRKSDEACCRARTLLRRYPSGVLLAFVEIPSPLRTEEYAELLGHEFEHIVEQIDDVELKAGAHRPEGTARSGARTFETERAHLAGKAVAAEVQDNRAGDL